jgi:hypothetical protein
MTDTRHKDANWRVHNNMDGTVPSQDARLAVLMDIRDELKALNRIMQCSNVSRGFVAMQNIDRRMQRNGMLLTKKK